MHGVADAPWPNQLQGLVLLGMAALAYLSTVPRRKRMRAMGNGL